MDQNLKGLMDPFVRKKEKYFYITEVISKPCKK